MSQSAENKQKAENRIIEKVRKLFALAADKGAVGAESENAMRMANGLLAKHSLEMSQLASPDTVFCTFADYNVKTPGNMSIIGSIARLYNCRIIFDANWTPTKSLIIGTGSNRMTATIVIDQILDQVRKETKGKNAMFKKGVAIGLAEVCQKIIDERRADKTEILPGTGLVPLDQMKQQDIANAEFVESNFKGLTRAKPIRGSEEGAAYGRSLNPGARVGGEGQRRIS